MVGSVVTIGFALGGGHEPGGTTATAGREAHLCSRRAVGRFGYLRPIIRHFRVVPSPVLSTTASALSPILTSPILLSAPLSRTLASPMGQVRSAAFWSVKV